MNGKQHRSALSHGTKLGKFVFYDVLYRGRFGITYEGAYSESKDLVAIKEYLPEGLATRTKSSDVSVVPHKEEDFKEGLEQFELEAKILEQCQHLSIVKFCEHFSAYGTAYIVTKFVKGEKLSKYLKDHRRLNEDKLKDILYPLLDALEAVHQKKFLHRDIKPDNIILCKEDDGLSVSPVLLDFGAAQSMGLNQKQVVTDHYSPPEQYGPGREQGPWTDIYALGAVCYEALMEARPNKGNEREIADRDTLHESFYVEGVSEEFREAIDKALKIEPSERPQTVMEWKEMMEQSSDPEPKPPTKPEPKGVADEVPPTKPLEKPLPPKKSPPFTRLVLGVGVVAALVVAIPSINKVYEVYKEEQAKREQAELVRKREQAEFDKELKIFREETQHDLKPKPDGSFKGEPHLHVASRLNLPTITKLLLDAGADDNATDANGRTPLHLAVKENAAAAVEVLLDAGADVNATDANDNTLLHLAAVENAVAVAKVLLKEGANVDAKNEDDWTPLHYAAINGYPKVAEVLLNRKADINAKAANGRTPLHLAALKNDSEVVKVLLNWKADVNAKAANGQTPLHLATHNSAGLIVEWFLKEEADANAKDKAGWTPLHYAAINGYPEVAEVLLKGGADVDAKTNDGKRPEDMDIAFSIRKLLFSYRLKNRLKR